MEDHVAAAAKCAVCACFQLEGEYAITARVSPASSVECAPLPMVPDEQKPAITAKFSVPGIVRADAVEKHLFNIADAASAVKPIPVCQIWYPKKLCFLCRPLHGSSRNAFETGARPRFSANSMSFGFPIAASGVTFMR